MNKDELDGKAEQLKGKVKQATGDLTDDEQLHDEGVQTRPRERSRKGSDTVAASSERQSKT